ncbi:S-layer homology domain-containing protein [Lysinibacillus agricola]|uniref:S-layer homology domain-containing protein n=1 Tax=Lysinibacillus agricola TaxID=2590012 RepID=UPI003C20DCFB
MLKRKIWCKILCSMFVLMILISFSLNRTGDDEYKINEPSERVSLALPNSTQLHLEANGLLLQKTTSSYKTYIRSTDQTTVYNLFEDGENMGSIKVTVREIDNGDFFIFTQLQNKSSKGCSATISYPISGNVRYDLIDFERQEIQHEHDNVSGVDPTTYPIGLLKVKENENLVTNMMISRNYVTKELIKKYENGDKSVVRELTSENKSLEFIKDNKGLTVTLPLHSVGNDLSENWMLVSQEPLFKKEQALDEWISQSTKHYKETNKWYTAEGPYTKLPWSIEPETKLGYGRNLVRVQDRKALNYYETTQERYFYDLLLNSVANLFIFQGDKKGLWETEYTSTWLKKDYGINAPYIDTRHNEKIALFLKEAGDMLDIKELKNSTIIYADFLVNQAKNGNLIEVPKGGYLVTDYYSPLQTKKTHVSLNHALGEMNFLLETYQQTKEESYLDVARNMRRGVENIGEKWLRENGDVWYQVNGDFTFEGTDYPLLTLEDLLKSQQSWEAVGEKRSEIFDRLIRSKAQYLVESKQEILRPVANSLINQGFGDIIEGYNNIPKF